MRNSDSLGPAQPGAGTRKYDALARHLASRGQARVTMSFAEIEAVLGCALPVSARNHRPWWANSGLGHVQARGWLDAGYTSEQVDLARERLVFVRRPAAAAEAGTDPATARPAGTMPGGDHPLFGCMEGTVTFAPGVDLANPAAPAVPAAALAAAAAPAPVLGADKRIEAALGLKSALLQGNRR